MSNAEAIARTCHEVNRVWCEFNGDHSQPQWEDAPGWQRESAIAGVQFHLANPDAGDSASHDEWMRHKLADGWVYGPVKDPEAKEHPCLVPFDALPRDQQFKDRLFRTIVHAAVRVHASDCGTHNEPAEPAGQCDCAGHQLVAHDRLVAMDMALRVETRDVNKTLTIADAFRRFLSGEANVAVHPPRPPSRPVPGSFDGF